VKSHLDEVTLKKIAEATGGMYQPLGAQGDGLTIMYEQGLAKFTRQDLSSRQTKVPLEKFYWPLLAALACFVCEWLIGNRRKLRTTNPAPAPVKTMRASGLRSATALLALLAGIASTRAATPQSAEQAYQKGDFAQAAQEYAATAAKQPAKPELQFNTGSAAYKAGDYAKAATGFQQSLKTGQVPVQQGAYYNLGNTQYRLGQKTEKTNPGETIKTWEEAVKSYDAALQITANDTKARHNRDLVQRKIEQLKKSQDQQKQDQQKQEQQKQDNKDQAKNQQANKDPKDQKNDAENQQAGSTDQKDDAKDKQNAADEHKNEPKDSKANEPQKPDQAQSAQADAKKDEQKDQKPDAKPQPGDEKKDPQRQADAKSQKGEPPKPVNAEKKPSQDQAEQANREKSEDAQAAAAAEERREPGQMTKEEAKQLLDALKDDERKAPPISARGRAAAQPPQNETLKDW
jgi:Ca-activated chloride channel family protein